MLSNALWHIMLQTEFRLSGLRADGIATAARAIDNHGGCQESGGFTPSRKVTRSKLQCIFEDL